MLIFEYICLHAVKYICHWETIATVSSSQLRMRALLLRRWMPHWTSLQPHSAPTAAISPKKRTGFTGNLFWICFSHDASIGAYQSPSPFETALQRVSERKQKSKFTQLSLRSNFNWMSTKRAIDVQFISTNAVTAKGQIASFRETGLWAFVRGLQTQRHLRWLREFVKWAKQFWSRAEHQAFAWGWFFFFFVYWGFNAAFIMEL